MTYEEYKNELYKMAEKDKNPEYAKEALDFADELKEIKRFYDKSKNIESDYYLLTY